MHVEQFQFLDHPIWLVTLPSLQAWPERQPEGLNRFSLLLVMDARGVSCQAIERFARLTIAQGINSFCAWGPDCERMHDSFDNRLFRMNREERRTGQNEFDVLTFWHADDTLDEAIFFLLQCADAPDPPYTDSWVAVVVDHPEWADHIRRRFADPLGDWVDAVYQDTDSGE